MTTKKSTAYSVYQGLIEIGATFTLDGRRVQIHRVNCITGQPQVLDVGRLTRDARMHGDIAAVVKEWTL